MLDADLAVPEPAAAVVLFAHGSGSSRHSPRNRFVARELQRSGLATVLADLLTPPEEQTGRADRSAPVRHRAARAPGNRHHRLAGRT